jgi:cation transporter-like permease
LISEPEIREGKKRTVATIDLIYRPSTTEIEKRPLGGGMRCSTALHGGVITVVLLQAFVQNLPFVSATAFDKRKTCQSLQRQSATLPTGTCTAMTKSSSAAVVESSSVLTELKETIRKQQVEIESLKKQLLKPQHLSTAAVHVSHHGGGAHGSGPAASQAEISSYLTQPFYATAFARVGWLALFLCSLSFTAVIMNGFEHTLQRQIELAYFVPLLAGHGGNTGGQTVGTVLSALSSKSVTLKDAPTVIAKEAMSGFMVGIILSGIVAPTVHYVMGISQHVATVMFFTLPWVSTIAATLGSAIPFACVALGLDPSVIAAPAMTSFVDVSGLMSYFLIANKVFSLFGIEL